MSLQSVYLGTTHPLTTPFISEKEPPNYFLLIPSSYEIPIPPSLEISAPQGRPSERPENRFSSSPFLNHTKLQTRSGDKFTAFVILRDKKNKTRKTEIVNALCALFCVYPEECPFSYHGSIENKTNIAFGAVLRRHREAANLSQMNLAARADLHLNTVSMLERGLRAPTLDTLLAICSALGNNPGEFVSEIVAEIESS